MMRHINTLEEFSSVFDIEPSTHPVELVSHDKLIVNNKFIIRPGQPIELVGEPWPSTFTQPVATIELFEWFASIGTDVFRALIWPSEHHVIVDVLAGGMVKDKFFANDLEQAIAVEVHDEMMRRFENHGERVALNDRSWVFTMRSTVAERQMTVTVPFDVIDIRRQMAPRSDANFGVTRQTITVNHIPTDMPVDHGVDGFSIRTIESVNDRADSHVGVSVDVCHQWSSDLEQWVLAGEFRVSSTGDEAYDDPWFVSGKVSVLMEDGSLRLWCRDARIRVANVELVWIVGDEVDAVAARRLLGQLGREIVSNQFGLDTGRRIEAMTFEDWERVSRFR